jgi:hypothetical protein
MGPATRDFFAFLRSPTWVAFLESQSLESPVSSRIRTTPAAAFT